MLLAHHPPDVRAVLLARVDEDQVLAGFDVVVELLELLVLARDAGQAAFPGAEHRDDRDEDEIDVTRDVRAEGFEVHQESSPDEPPNDPYRRADEAVADDVERFEVVAGMDVLPFQPGFVLRDNVEKEILDARSMEIIGDPMSALQRGCEVVKTTHHSPHV